MRDYSMRHAKKPSAPQKKLELSNHRFLDRPWVPDNGRWTEMDRVTDSQREGDTHVKEG